MRIVGTIAAALSVLGVFVGPYAVSSLPPYWLSGGLVGLAEFGLLGVAVYLLWPELSIRMKVAVGTVSALAGGTVAWLAFVIAGFALENYRVCTSDGSERWPSVGLAAGLLVYTAIGTIGFQRSKRMPVVWVLAGIVGAAVFFGLTLAFPPGHSFCET